MTWRVVLGLCLGVAGHRATCSTTFDADSTNAVPLENRAFLGPLRLAHTLQHFSCLVMGKVYVLVCLPGWLSHLSSEPDSFDKVWCLYRSRSESCTLSGGEMILIFDGGSRPAIPRAFGALLAGCGAFLFYYTSSHSHPAVYPLEFDLLTASDESSGHLCRHGGHATGFR
jgi:hypothetical protein